jgi:hypothetical protein
MKDMSWSTTAFAVLCLLLILGLIFRPGVIMQFIGKDKPPPHAKSEHLEREELVALCKEAQDRLREMGERLEAVEEFLTRTGYGKRYDDYFANDAEGSLSPLRQAWFESRKELHVLNRKCALYLTFLPDCESRLRSTKTNIDDWQALPYEASAFADEMRSVAKERIRKIDSVLSHFGITRGGK